MIYETKGLSLEEVDELYGIVGKAWQSKKFRPAVKFAELSKDGDVVRGASLADIAAAQERRRSSMVPQQMRDAKAATDNEIEKT
jgi:SP family sugar:H+ symporter-like MFS transporter